MKEPNASKTVQTQQTLSNSKEIKSDIVELRNKFKEGSIPLQTDFKKLIEIADIGRRAVGKAPDQSGLSQGMCLDDDGLLQLKINEEHNKEDYSPLMLNEEVLVVDLECIPIGGI
ncbi:hypothetical protein [Xenorhabdus bovienii]|uniref:Uncharacterized protein n=1 Tax=Xenorhabdus bovienii str. kraussei Becker Underwood TaxID=1398204 RepID=A0A077PVI3_XENBV|nr:hypothetical protein [Xenorhabdus bovienii]CDH25088.1 conserved hypothetical protein [Xenorhabdus bovienii str. kraussei Becker Underwood]